MNPTPTLDKRSFGARFDFLQALRRWQKFALLGAIAIALAAFPVYRLFKGVEESISQVRTEESGLTAITAALELVQKLQDHRASASYFVLGDEKRGAAEPKDAAAVAAALAKLHALTDPLDSKQVDERIGALEKSWAALKDNVVN